MPEGSSGTRGGARRAALRLAIVAIVAEAVELALLLFQWRSFDLDVHLGRADWIAIALAMAVASAVVLLGTADALSTLNASRPALPALVGGRRRAGMRGGGG
jgi:hypothetical protein